MFVIGFKTEQWNSDMETVNDVVFHGKFFREVVGAGGSVDF